MPLIKQPETTRTQAFSLADIALEGRAIIARAERQAGEIIAAAQAQAAAIGEQSRADGFQAGFKEGHAAGRDDAVKKCEQQLARAGRSLAEAVEQFAANRARMQAEARNDLVRLALAAGEKILRREITADPTVCLRTVEAAVELAGRASRLSIRVNPSDLELVQSVAPQLAARLTGQADVQVVADEGIEPGGCRLAAWRQTGQAGEIDATIATQLDRLADELLGEERGLSTKTPNTQSSTKEGDGPSA